MGAPRNGPHWPNSGQEFFKGSRVGSARGVVCSRGTAVAIPFSTGATPRRARSTPGKAAARSEYKQAYRGARYQHCSMARKPLSGYDPLAARSRLAEADAPTPLKNASHIHFSSDPLHTDKDRFVTTYQTSFRGDPLDVRSNTGVLSQEAAWKHTLRDKGLFL
mmetsp:Transcript_134846/g.336466  ORF Transcript_134846/g.336466 Transcript_134846/m.336466 type:complete len:163 (+) Transcript_134846:103-591(+)